MQGTLGEHQVAEYEEESHTEAGDGEEGQDHEAAGFLDDEAPRVKKVRVEDPTAAVRRAVGEHEDSGTRKRATAARGRGRGRGDSKRVKTEEAPELEDAEEDEEGGGEDHKIDWELFKKRDPEMYAVAIKHYDLTGKASWCFHALKVESFLTNQKLGQVLNGVTRPLR